MTSPPAEIDGPLLPDVGVLALVPEPWGEQWNSRHHVLSRLSRYFHVVWVNPAHGWRDVLRRPAVPPPAPGASALEVYTAARWLPGFHRPDWLAHVTLRARLARARARLRARGCTRIVLYVWRPEFAAALDAVAHDLSCYHVDDEYSFARDGAPPDPRELRLLERADQVIIHSPELFTRKGGVNAHSVRIPNGVDYAAYSTPAREPEDLATVPRPRMGYTGWIKKQLDWPLLEALSAQHPEWSFVFVGGRTRQPDLQAAAEALGRHANVFFLGPKTSRQIVRYPQHFDVCLMPYAVTDYTHCIYPMKLHEYLASGRPVVGPPIRSLEEFSGAVSVAIGAAEWSRALRESLAPEANDAAAVRARRAVARRHDWQVLVRRIAHVFAARLGHPAAGTLADTEFGG